MKTFILFTLITIKSVISIENRENRSSNSRMMVNSKNPAPYFVHNSVQPVKKFGITNKIAELVSSSYGNFHHLPSQIYYPKENILLMKDEEESPSHPHLMTGVLKMLGFDSRKIGAIAVNGFVFIARMLADNLITTSNNEPKSESSESSNSVNEDEDPEDFGKLQKKLFENEEFKHLESDILNPNLSSHVMSLMENYGASPCTMLLLCKLKPFIVKMQSELTKSDSNSGDDDSTPTGTILKKIPRIEDFNLNGLECERKYRNCKIF